MRGTKQQVLILLFEERRIEISCKRKHVKSSEYFCCHDHLATRHDRIMYEHRTSVASLS